MRDIVKNNWLKDFGIELTYIASSFVGSLLAVSKKNNRRKPFWEKILIVLGGVFSSNYLTPLAVWIFNIPDKVQYAISFTIGYAGLNLVSYFIEQSKIFINNKR